MAAPSLDITFQCLARSENGAAAEILLLALDSPEPALREQALAALLSRRDHPYQLQILARWETAGEGYREKIVAQRGRIASALREAIAGERRELFASACEVTLATADYDLAPSLIAVCERDGEFAQLAGKTLLSLVDRLHEQWQETLKPAADADSRRETQLKRTHLLFALERSLDRFETHRAAAPVEALVALADHQNETLRQLLNNPRRAAHRAVVKVLIASDAPGVVRLLVEFLDDSQAPLAVARIVGQRTDAAFLRSLLGAVSGEPAPALRNLLKRIESFRWLEANGARDGAGWPAWLSDDEHRAAVTAIVISGMSRLAALDGLRRALASDAPAARRAAAAALAEFHGAEANRLVLEGAGDFDPVVQASCVAQLREHGVPTALAVLLDRLDSPFDEVRSAAASALGEFTVARYLATFETLTEAARAESGSLVRKVDPAAVRELAAEFASSQRNRRLRAIQAAPYIVGGDGAAAEEIAAALAGLLGDSDAGVRAAAANMLDEFRMSASTVPAGAFAGAFWAFQSATRFDLSSTPDPANVAGFLWVLLMLAVFAAALVLIKRYLSWRERPKRGSASSLFRELCRAHRLSASDRRLLRRLARAAEIAPAARLFVEPMHFDDAATAGGFNRTKVLALRESLFGR